MERPCFDTFQSLNQSPHTRFKRDGITRRFGLIPLPPKPFNHLSVVAYLAIGVVVLASSLVAGYLVYSCYHSARGKGVEQNTTLRNEDFRDTELGIYEKDEIINDLELRRLEFQHSESKVNFQTSPHIFYAQPFLFSVTFVHPTSLTPKFSLRTRVMWRTTTPLTAHSLHIFLIDQQLSTFPRHLRRLRQHINNTYGGMLVIYRPPYHRHHPSSQTTRLLLS